MKPVHRWVPVGMLAAAVLALLGAGADQDRLWQHRNLGKAFYENPATQAQAVEAFQKALELAPGSARERVNYGLALLRAGRTMEGIAELERAQKQDPRIPHTWFNLGIAFKKEGQYDRAAAQFEQMVRLAPGEPVSHYNLAVLYKLAGKTAEALRHFETAARLNPNLAGPHFQLYNAYRQAGRTADAARELQVFQQIKKRQEGAAVPEDMEWSYYAEIYETVEPMPRDEPAAALAFEERTLAGKYDPATAGLIVLDADGDGRPDLLAWSGSGARLYRNGDTPAGAGDLDRARGVVSIAAGDFDNDGFPDLCVVTGAGAALYRNERGAFRKLAAQLPAGRFAKAVWLDYDHDYDLDLVLLGGASALVRNNGEAGFSGEAGAFPFVPGEAVDGAVFDLVTDTDGMDLAVSYRGRPGVLYRDGLGGRYEAEPLPALPANAKPLLAADLDNDGWTDLAAPGRLLVNRAGKLETAAGPESALALADLENRGVLDILGAGAVHRNLGMARFAPSSASIPRAVAAAAADFDADGRGDLALVGADGVGRLLSNRTPGNHHWVRVALAGVKNLKLAPMAEVEVKSGAGYQKRNYAGVPLLFGLGRYQSIDTVRITWPNGLIQNEPRQPVDRALQYKEAPRLSGSCPMIFTWNGREFEFLTDVLGVAPLGASAGDGRYFPVDHDEYVQIAGESLQPVNGRYPIRITEELREVSYLDQVRLIAVDHPAEVEIFTNDKFKAPPFPEFRLFGVRRRIYPARASDERGRDVRELLLRRDLRYPDSFRRDSAGAAEPHYLDLDFGDVAPGNRAVLVLNGWVDWADGSTFRNAAQAGRELVTPYLQVKDSAGRWRTVIQDMGLPAGKPKTIAVDLSGKFLSRSRAVRIATNVCVYWDEVFLSEQTAAPPVRLHNLDAASAELRFRGFSRPVIHPERKQPERFEYARHIAVPSWNPTPGRYTRYGDVRELIEAADDRLAILGSGDELRLEFPQPPPARPGWRRDFLLLVDGWAKDGDANTAYSQSVEPLPFHGMSSYPYPPPEAYPDTPAHRAYRQRYNTRPALRLVRRLAVLP